MKATGDAYERSPHANSIPGRSCFVDVKVTVTCPFCGHVNSVQAKVEPAIRFGWTPSTLFLTAEFKGASGIEHHCEALRKTVDAARVES